MHEVKCKVCGKLFQTNNNNTVCDGPHFRPCVICGKPVKFHRPSDPQVCCSDECSAEKRRRTNLKKYGAINPGCNADVQAKMRATCMKKFGQPNVMMSSEVRERNKKEILQYHNTSTEDDSNDADEMRQKIEHYCSLLPATSQGQAWSILFSSILDELGISHQCNFRLGYYTYNICIPEQKTLIEIDPTVYHHSYRGPYLKSSAITKSADYHLKKTRVAEKHGYRCIHIFDWDDPMKILCSLKVSDVQTIDAEKCTIEEVTTDIANQFLCMFDFQGVCKKIDACYGLYYDNQLVQVMTFVKKGHCKYKWELLRMRTDFNYHVVDGAHKLFQQFIKDINPESVVAYCDRAKFTADEYKETGMTQLPDVIPQKIWSKGVEMRLHSREFMRKYREQLNNEEMMLCEGWLPLYDCGQFMFEYRRTTPTEVK